MLSRLLVIILLVSQSNHIFAQNDSGDIEDFFTPKTTIGGYGELHYNQENSELKNTTKTLDFHRFVLFFGHNWTEQWSFKAEVEIEHNFVESGQGELAIEQAYLNFKANNYFGIKAGVLLSPVGLINEIHEPPTFLSVERPDYSKYIIPTTWFGNGAAIYGNIKGFDYLISAIEGLDGNELTTENIKSSGIRKARQEGFKSNAHSILFSGRLNYTGMNGVLLGGSFSFNNAVGKTVNTQMGLSEFHVSINKYNIVAVGEFANIAYSSDDINNSQGYYFDLGYDLGRFLGYSVSIIPFVRYTDYNTAYSTSLGGDSEEEFHFTKWMVGISVKPIDEVVIKFDYSERTNSLSNIKTQLFNVGVGYMF